MSRKVPLPEGALSVNETTVEKLHEVRPKSGSLSSDDGETGGPKQGRFFKSLTRSLDPAASAPPKKDFLDEYQKYKAKRAFNLHGIVKQQTIDLGTLGSSSQTQSDKIRKFSTGTISEPKSATLPHGSRGPPPPVAPRKKSVNLPPIGEPAQPHLHDSSSYILSAAKKEHHADADFQKFRSLTGPTSFRPAKNGPSTAPRKITPTLTLQNGSRRDETALSPNDGVAKDILQEGDAAATKDNANLSDAVGESKVKAEAPDGQEEGRESAATEVGSSVQVQEEEGGSVSVHELEPVVENVEKENDAEKSEEAEPQQEAGEVSSSSLEQEGSKSDTIQEVKEVVKNDTNESCNSVLTENVVSDQTELAVGNVSDSIEDSLSVVVEEKGVSNSGKSTEKEVTVDDNKEEETEKTAENRENPAQTEDQCTGSKDDQPQSTAGTIESKEDLDGTTDKILEDNNRVGISDAEQCAVVENAEQKVEEKEAESAQRVEEENAHDVEKAGDVAHVQGESQIENSSENKGESPIENAPENTGESPIAVESEVKSEETVEDSNSNDVDKSGDSAENEGESSMVNSADNKGESPIEGSVHSDSGVVENCVAEEKYDINAKETTTDSSEKTVEDNTASTDKLSKMADMLLSFSEDKKETLATNDDDLARVGEELQKLNSCIEEISDVQQQEAKPEDLEKLENIEAMRKEMQDMVKEFDTYL